jgi:ABC-type multidrug transport system ATPase subunit
MSLLVVSGVKKLLGGRRALDGVDLVWDGPGTLVVFGENGAGKSTLLRVVGGILDPDEGEITIAGHRMSSHRVEALRHVGYAPEAADLPPHLGVGELVALAASLKRCDRPSPLLVERLGVGPLLDKRFGALSLGQKRRAGLLSALVGDPDLLVLDEPTNGLDVDGIGILVELLRERRAAGKAAIAASHDRDFIERTGAGVVEIHAGKATFPRR